MRFDTGEIAYAAFDVHTLGEAEQIARAWTLAHWIAQAGEQGTRVSPAATSFAITCQYKP